MSLEYKKQTNKEHKETLSSKIVHAMWGQKAAAVGDKVKFFVQLHFVGNGSEIELVKPTTADSGLARYLEKRGPGMHHVCLEVDDLAEIIARLKEKGFQLINEEPRTSSDGCKYAFIHPKSTHGVLVELYQITGDKGKRNKG